MQSEALESERDASRLKCVSGQHDPNYRDCDCGMELLADEDCPDCEPLAGYDPWFHRRRCETGDGDPQNMECMVCGAALGETCRRK